MSGRALCVLWGLLLVGLCSCDEGLVNVHGSVVVVGAGECVDCAQQKIQSADAFSGLHVAIDCKASDGEFKTRGVGELDKEGKYQVKLPTELLNDAGELKEECFAQLLSASEVPCPAQKDLELPKIVPKSKDDQKHTFTTVGKLSFTPATCTSKLLLPLFKQSPLFTVSHFKHIPFPKKVFPPLPPHKKPPKFFIPPKPTFKKPFLPPPTPLFSHSLFKKPLPPIPKILPIHKKPITPIPKLPPLYKKPMPKFPPIYKKPMPPIPKFPPHKPKFPPMNEEKPFLPLKKFPHFPQKKPLPPLPKYPPIKKKPLPPIPKLEPKPLPPLPKYPPIKKKPLPPIPKLEPKPLPPLPKFPPIKKKPLPPIPKLEPKYPLPPIYKKKPLPPIFKKMPFPPFSYTPPLPPFSP